MPAKKKNRVKKIQKQTPDRTEQGRSFRNGSGSNLCTPGHVCLHCKQAKFVSVPLFSFGVVAFSFYPSPPPSFSHFFKHPIILANRQTSGLANTLTHALTYSLTNSFHCIMLHFRAFFGQQQQQQLETNTQFQVWSGQLNFSIQPFVFRLFCSLSNGTGGVIFLKRQGSKGTIITSPLTETENSKKRRRKTANNDDDDDDDDEQ